MSSGRQASAIPCALTSGQPMLCAWPRKFSSHQRQSSCTSENGDAWPSSRAAQIGQCGLASAGRPRKTRSISSSRIARSAFLRDAEIPARAHGDADLAAHAVGALQHEADLVHRRIGHLVGVEAEREVGEVEPVVLHHLDGGDGIVELRALGMEIVGAEPHRQRVFFRPYRADRIERLAVEACTVLDAAAVLVGALIGERREEARAEVAVRIMHLEPSVAGLERAPGGFRVGLVQALDLVDRQLVYRIDVPAAAIGDRRGRDAGPAVGVVGRQLLPGAFRIGAAMRRKLTALSAPCGRAGSPAPRPSAR